MKTFSLFAFSILLAMTENVLAQNVMISGTVKDLETGEPLPYANIVVVSDSTGTITNRFGYFSIRVTSQAYHNLKFSYVGYQTIDTLISIENRNQASITVRLVSQTVALSEVEVTGMGRSAAPWYPSTQVLVQKQLEFIPSPGERDLLRSLQRLPGITSNSELSSGLFIRGGTPDQNLILMDGVTVYNPSHVFGFFSMFHHDALKAVKVMKGGFPAEYGMRSGSIIDILSIDGNNRKMEGKASLGLINAGLLLNGPVGNGSWMVAGRRSFFELFRLLAGGFDIPDYYFYDTHAKVTQHIDDNNRLGAQLLLNKDEILHESRTGRGSIDERLNSRWSNFLFGLEWTSILSHSTYLKVLTSTSQYAGNLTATPNALLQKAYGTGSGEFSYKNSLRDITGKIDLEHVLSANGVLTGGVYFTQYSIGYSSNARFNYEITEIERTYTVGGLFSQFEMRIGDFSLIPGIRVTKQEGKTTPFLEPRLIGAYRLTPTLQVRAGAGRYYQWINGGQPASFLTFTGIDFWFPIDQTIDAPRTSQISADLVWNTTPSLTATASVYYSQQRNLVELRQDFEDSNNLRGMFTQGRGRNYGVEFLLEGKAGPVSGMLGYTLSWAKRQFAEIDGNREFFARHDKRHVFDLTASFKLSESWDFSLAWNYSTGQAYTGILGYYELSPFTSDISAWNTLHFVLGQRNSSRLPNYHRLDLGATKTFDYETWKLKLRIDVFNAYSRLNALGANTGFSSDPYYRLLPIVPTVTLEAEF